MSDPFFSNVKLLLGFEGADASTVVTDESASARGNATMFGNAQIDTAQFKFGTSALLLDGTLDHISFADSADWQFSGEFTVEMFVRFGAMGGASNTIIGHMSSVSQFGWWLAYSNTGVVRFRFDDNGDATPLHDISSGAGEVTTGTWYHIAVDRDASSKLRLYINGVMKASKTSATGASFNVPGVVNIGAASAGGGQPMTGWLDELRVTQGVARYASDAGFTVPTAEFPRTGGAAPITMPAAAGAILLAGADAGLKTARGLPAAASAILLSGANVNLDVTHDGARTMLATAGAILLSGPAIEFDVTRVLTHRPERLQFGRTKVLSW